MINTKSKKFLLSGFKVITTSKLNNSIAFGRANFVGRGPTRWGPRAEGRGTQTPFNKSKK